MKSGYASPWTDNLFTGGLNDVLIKDCNENPVGYTYCNRADWIRNARLIARAPELLDACETIVHEFAELDLSNFSSTQVNAIRSCERTVDLLNNPMKQDTLSSHAL